MFIRKVQNAVHEQNKAKGGYLPVLSSVARLIEKTADLKEVAARGGEEVGRVKEELLELFVTSTCIANQYSINLYEWAQAYNKLPGTEAPDPAQAVQSSTWREGLVSLAGHIARTVNAYEGVDVPPEPRQLSPLGQHISDLHVHLLRAAGGQTLVSSLMNALPEQPLSTRAPVSAPAARQRFDPTLAPVLSRFNPIQTRTLCPFAPRAKVWGAPDWQVGASVEQNARWFAPYLERFTQLQRWETLDGFIVEVADPDLYPDLETLAANFHRFLVQLNQMDPTGTRIFERQVKSTEWQFEFNGVRLFIIVFSPLYGEHSSRDSYGAQGTFILLQPEESFREFNIPREETQPVKREQIRARFREQGRRYDSAIMQQSFEALRYLKPLRPDEPEVEWWLK
ncbi:YqcI/YcgG family protein [Corallococcus sp. bb12-1]|uniref:YqcI/YcgG family protein n=1 Tax=Corallococcus sp. bb12-1 TaxID=2996784 RepID=UPI00226EC1F6|nr:YqcI/YcgG family protein [Corallococcus sp. bb12-1]MCY1041130.1 YqcI/YcgG family protein [Corallococcus sp. bb12-1]